MVARIWQLARFILAEAPRDAERWGPLLAAGLPVDPATTERFVLGFGAPEDRGYIVGDRGTMTTRLAPPDWADPSDVIEVAWPKGDSESIWIEFRSLVDGLKAAAPELYDGIGIGHTASTIDAYYTSPQHAALAHVQESSRLAPVPVARVGELLADPESARSWAHAASNALVVEYRAMRLPIERAAAALVTLQFIARGEDPRVPLAAGLLRVLVPAISSDQVETLMLDFPAVTQLASEYPFPSAVLGIMFKPGFYALTMEFARFAGLRYAFAVACEIQDSADHLLDGARTLTSIQRFYAALADVQLRHRAADAMFAELVKMLANAPDRPAFLAPLENRRVISAERDVSVRGSFMHATGLVTREVDPTSFPSVGWWATHLAGQGAAQARSALHDLALRLVVPTFVRDLMLGIVYRMLGESERARATLLRVSKSLERDRAVNSLIPGEPAYLPPLYEELAQAHEDLGDPDAATRFRRLAEAEAKLAVGEIAAALTDRP